MSQREYQVLTPDGKSISITADENATDEELISIAQQQLGSGYATPVVDRRARLGLGDVGDIDLAENIARTATFGATDIAAGLTAAGINAIKAPFSDIVDFDPVAAYNQQFADTRAAHDEYRDENWWTALAGDLVGGGAGLRGSIPQIYKAAEGATLPFLRRLANGTALGAGFGGLQGFGNGEGFERLWDGALGAGAGATLGGGLTAAGQILSPVVGGIRRLLGGGEGLATQRVVEAMDAEGLSPAAAGAAMDAAHRDGVPLMLADQGENLQRLLAAVRRQPGPGRNIAGSALRARQLGANERVLGAIQRDLGDTTNVDTLSDDLLRRAQELSDPLYAEAFQQPLVSTPRLRDLIERPSMRRATANAFRIADEEGRDPSALGFVLDDSGNVQLNPFVELFEDGTMAAQPLRERVPSVQTMDYVKRGLDDVIESYRDTTTGRLNLDTEGWAINNTLRDFLAELDAYNPAYRQARMAFAGPASERDALRRGAKAVTETGPSIDRMADNLTETQRQQFALGMRSELADRLSKRPDLGNGVGFLIGSPQKRQAIQRAAGPDADIQRFFDTMEAERVAGDTYRMAMTGSPTAINLADDAIVDDAGLISDALGRGFKGARSGGFWGGIANMLAPLADARRFGSGNVGSETRKALASLLTETDPLKLSEAMYGLSDFQRRAALRGQDVGRLGDMARARFGGAIGGFVAPPQYVVPSPYEGQ